MVEEELSPTATESVDEELLSRLAAADWFIVADHESANCKQNGIKMTQEQTNRCYWWRLIVRYFVTPLLKRLQVFIMWQS